MKKTDNRTQFAFRWVQVRYSLQIRKAPRLGCFSYLVRATGLDLLFLLRRRRNEMCCRRRDRRQADAHRASAFRWVRVRYSLQIKKSTPLWGAFLIWCGQQDSNLHAYAMEPKGDVTLVKVLGTICSTRTLFERVYFCVGTAMSEKNAKWKNPCG